jgi:nitrous oxidase accessory protein NosD
MQGLIINDNTVTHSGTPYFDYYGVAIHNTSGYLEMLRNRITGGVGHALRLYYCSGIEAQPSLIANNFLHSNSNYGTFYILYGLNYTQIYHNSIHNTSGGVAFEFNRYQSTGNRIVNNIFKANTGYAVEYQTVLPASISEANYNNLFTSGSFVVRDGSTNYGSLSSWQTASGISRTRPCTLPLRALPQRERIYSQWCLQT